MNSPTMTRQQRRQMQKLAEAVFKITEGDRWFFERRPDRVHRVRLAGQAEIEQQAIVEGNSSTPPGWRVFCVCRNVAPGARMRLFIHGLEGSETDLPETAARKIFETAATPMVWGAIAELEAALEARA